jgi:hypothetical protein
LGCRETRAVLRSPARVDGIERCLRLSDRGSHHEQADISTLSDERLDALEAALRQTVLMLEQANVFRLGLRLQHEVCTDGVAHSSAPKMSSAAKQNHSRYVGQNYLRRGKNGSVELYPLE